MAVAINGTEIDDQAIDHEVQHHPAPTLEQARESAIRALVVREVLLQQVARLGIEASSESGVTETEDEARIRVLIEREVAVPSADEDACRRYFANHPDKFRSPDLFEVSHILIAADPGDHEARQNGAARARKVLEDLQHNPQQFAELAARFSDCPSKHSGGNLGQISRGQTVAEFEVAVRRMQPGTLCTEVVESRYGYHVVYLARRIDGQPLEYEQVSDRIAGYLNDSVRRRAISQYLDLLIGSAEITGFDLEGARSPLVQ